MKTTLFVLAAQLLAPLAAAEPKTSVDAHRVARSKPRFPRWTV